MGLGRPQSSYVAGLYAVRDGPRWARTLSGGTEALCEVVEILLVIICKNYVAAPNYSLLATYRLLPAAHHLLPATCDMLLTTMLRYSICYYYATYYATYYAAMLRYSVLTIHYQPTLYYLLLATHYYSVVTTHYSLHTTHYASPTAHHSGRRDRLRSRRLLHSLHPPRDISFCGGARRRSICRARGTA